MNKITFSSRYYEPLRILQNKVDNGTVYKYLYEEYKNEINPIVLSSKIFDSVEKYLIENLYSNHEKALLIANLTPFVEHYGERNIGLLNDNIALINDLKAQDKEELKIEYKNTIEGLLKVRELLKKRFIAYYLKLISSDLNTNVNRLFSTETKPIVTEFFNKIKECSLTQIEILNTVESLTHNFEINRLIILIEDFDFYLFQEKDVKSAEFTENDITIAIQKLKAEKKPIPYLKIPNRIKAKTGYVEIKNESENILDLEKLLFPFDFFGCYEFKKFLLKELNQRNSVKVNHVRSLTDITNNFDSTEIEDVYSHFKSGLVEKKYLTESDLLSYLKAAFEIMTIPQPLFKIKDAPTKQKVMKVFYEYYKNVAGKPHGKKNKYAALLGNYFEGFTTKNVSSNFNK
jgi:hypothetical protein